MNKERLELLAQALDRGFLPDKGDDSDLGFNMHFYRMGSEEFDDKLYFDGVKLDNSGHQCQTAGCLAGWTAAMFGYCGINFYEFAKNALDISDEIALSLMHPYSDEAWLATPQQAAKVIRELIKTGVVNWTGVLANG